jgi:hypothetical protein
MSKLYKLSICLSDIPKEALKVASNGNAYCYCDLWINDEKNQYGNIGTISITQTKEMRETKSPKEYIGNVKELEPKQPETNKPSAWDEFLAK